jgi:L-serine dehydratase
MDWVEPTTSVLSAFELAISIIKSCCPECVLSTGCGRFLSGRVVQSFMHTSLFDLFKIGIGPSSSHTVGPMRAAYRFAEKLSNHELLEKVTKLRVELFGSLALTGLGHGTDRGILLGLMGKRPDEIDPSEIQALVESIRKSGVLPILAKHPVPFTPDDLVLDRQTLLPGHSNGMRFTATAADGVTLLTRVYYSVGGGFIAEEGGPSSSTPARSILYPFRSAKELLRLGEDTSLPIHIIILTNEMSWRPLEQIRDGIHRIWTAMRDCTNRGLGTRGELPGGLAVRRRAADMARRLEKADPADPLGSMDWLNVWAIAVNEENAAGGRVVTAPTNGAAGIIPSVAHYYMRFLDGTEEGIYRYFLGAAAIGVLYKENASLSGAEVGCQGEVGVACSMAAGGLVSALDGTNDQVEHAAEIAMEHNLGMTCDPVGGLVQIPCIERNAFGAVKAVNAARMAMKETGGHKVSLDQVIRTMYQTGLDMQSRYKETALGGLALNVIEC